MPEIKPNIETFANIKVVGVGGGGGAAVSRMVQANIRGVDFVAVNTDAQDLHHNPANRKFYIGKTVTKGLGAGMNPELGRKAAEESLPDLQEMFKGTDMVFITCGLGGGTGSGASPIIAGAARDAGALTVAVVTKPFIFEGAQRSRIAEQALQELESKVDAIITVPNERILQIVDRKIPLMESFKIVDDVLRQGIQGIADLITVKGTVNVDFADVKSIMKDSGTALMGIGIASGENRAVDAAKKAISSPLLETAIDGASGVLLCITGGPDLSMHEVNEAAKAVTQSADRDARVIFGVVIDQDMKDEMKITVIATGFDQSKKFSSIDREKDIFQPQRKAHFFEQVKNEEISEEDIKVKTKEIEEREEDEELDIPSFIKKKMM